MQAEPCLPLLYRSEAFAEDLDAPAPTPAARGGPLSRRTLLAGLVPALLALAAGAASLLVPRA